MLSVRNSRSVSGGVKNLTMLPVGQEERGVVFEADEFRMMTKSGQDRLMNILQRRSPECNIYSLSIYQLPKLALSVQAQGVVPQRSRLIDRCGRLARAMSLGRPTNE